MKSPSQGHRSDYSQSDWESQFRSQPDRPESAD